MSKIWNFSAGPAQLPESVVANAQGELVSYDGTGMSVMELSHRSQTFVDILQDAESSLRRLLGVSEDYAVLFLQGGASLQFAMVPMNLKKDGKAAYIHTGNWSEKAIKEAERLAMTVDIVASGEAEDFTAIPEFPTDYRGYDYVHVTSNNTIKGTAIYDFPDTGDVPLVADMSSNLLSEPIDVSQFGLIYAGAQKNLGIAGMTLVIIRKDLLNRHPDLPKILNYQTHYEKESAFNTPPTYPIYISKLVFEWIEELGGLEAMARLNKEKADLLYGYLDQSELFRPTVQGANRSLMNVTFVTDDAEVDKKFVAFCDEHGLKNIKGHRSVGGMRASIYNAMPLEGVQALVDAMETFEKEYLEG